MTGQEESAGGKQEAGFESEPGHGQLVEYNDACTEETREFGADDWYNERELQELFMDARPTWNLADVGASVKKLRDIGIWSIADLRHELARGEINDKLLLHNHKTFSRTTLRELKKRIAEKDRARRFAQTQALMDKPADKSAPHTAAPMDQSANKSAPHTDKEFWVKLSKTITESRRVWELDFEERVQQYVEEHLETHFQGELSAITDQIWSRLKCKMETDLAKTERRLARRVDEIHARIEELTATIEASAVRVYELEDIAEAQAAKVAKLTELCSSRPTTGAAASGHHRAAGGLAKQAGESPRRRAFREAAHQQQPQQLPQQPTASVSAGRGNQSLEVAPCHWAMGSDVSSVIGEYPESHDDAVSDLSSLHGHRAFVDELKTSLCAAVKVALKDVAEEDKNDDSLSMWYKDMEVQAPLGAEIACEPTNTRALLAGDGLPSEHTISPDAKKKTKMGLIRDYSRSGEGEWETSDHDKEAIRKSRKPRDLCEISIYPETPDEPEVTPRVFVTADPRDLNTKEMEPPEETSKAKQHFVEGSSKHHVSDAAEGESTGWFSRRFRKSSRA